MATKTKTTKRMIRGKDAMTAWVSKGSTSDRAIGSKAKTILAELSPSDAAMKGLRSAYAKVVKVVDGMSEDDQRAVLLAAASDFTLDSLLAKSKESVGYAVRIGDRDRKRIDAIRAQKGDAAAEQFEEMLLWSKGATKGTNGKVKG